MDTRNRRRGLVGLVTIALVTGAAIPAFGDAAIRTAAHSIGTAALKNGAVTDAKVRRGSLRFTVFRRGEVAPGNLKGIKAGGVLAGTYPKPQLARGAVQADALAVGSVRASAIATGAVGRSEIASGAVGSEEIASGAVRANDLADGSIGPSKLALNSVGRPQLAAASVGASEIAKGAVGVPELAALPGARVYRLANLTLPDGALVEVLFTDADYTQGGVWSSNQPGRLTAPVDGVYQVTAGAVFQAGGSGVRGIWIVPAGQPGSPYAGEVQGAITQSGQTTEFVVAVMLRLLAGETIAMAVRQTSGGDIALLASGERTALGLQFVSP